MGAKTENREAKTLFLILSSLSRIGDRMWGFAAFLLLAHAFPDHKFILGGVYGVSNALSTAIFSSWVGGWIDRKQRLPAATTLLVIQNLSVAIAATVQILVMEWPDDWPSLSENVHFFLIGMVTLFSCIAMLASIGYGIVMERDWIPQVFQGELLTSVNAWVRRIDQTAMLLGPIIASLAIDGKPWLGGLVIAGWNVVSLFIELHVMRKIYNQIPELQEPKDISKSSSKTEFKNGLVDWVEAWRLWMQSPVCIPGIALAVLYTNIFQLSFLAQAYASSHCISSKVLAAVWILAGVCGFTATWCYEYFIKNFGLVRCAIVGAVLHFSFVLGTIGGLFVDGSQYQLYLQVDECPAQLNSTTLIEQDQAGMMAWSNSSIVSYYVIDYSAPCTPPESLVSILFMLVCCGMSRCGLWLFDLAVSQMFQEWVEPKNRGRVSGAQSGAQYFFDCVHFGLVFIWTEQCEYGHGILLTAGLMFLGYGNFIVRALCTKSFDDIPNVNEKQYEIEKHEKSDAESNSNNNRTDALLS